MGAAFLVFIWGVFLFFIGALDKPDVIVNSVLGMAVIFLALNQYYVSKKQGHAMEEGLDKTQSILVQNRVMVEAAKRQAKAAEDAVSLVKQERDPRLRITDVELLGLEMGETPFFTVWIVNEGAVDAVDVALHMNVENTIDGTEMKWSREQIITIAARERRCIFVKWSTTVEGDLLKKLNSKSKSMTIRGYNRHADTEEFCYGYYAPNPHGRRPKGIPQFLPCDFVPGLEIVMHAGGARFLDERS